MSAKECRSDAGRSSKGKPAAAAAPILGDVTEKSSKDTSCGQGHWVGQSSDLEPGNDRSGDGNAVGGGGAGSTTLRVTRVTLTLLAPPSASLYAESFAGPSAGRVRRVSRCWRRCGVGTALSRQTGGDETPKTFGGVSPSSDTLALPVFTSFETSLETAASPVSGALGSGTFSGVSGDGVQSHDAGGAKDTGGDTAGHAVRAGGVSNGEGKATQANEGGGVAVVPDACEA